MKGIFWNRNKLSLDNIQLNLLGQARRIIVNKDSTTIINSVVADNLGNGILSSGDGDLSVLNSIIYFNYNTLVWILFKK